MEAQMEKKAEKSKSVSKLIFRGWNKKKPLIRGFCELLALYPEGWHEIIRLPGVVLALSEGEHLRNLEAHLPRDWRTYFPNGLGAHFQNGSETPIPKVTRNGLFTGKEQYMLGLRDGSKRGAMIGVIGCAIWPILIGLICLVI